VGTYPPTDTAIVFSDFCLWQRFGFHGYGDGTAVAASGVEFHDFISSWQVALEYRRFVG
jgi:hypothetical protein